jgi:hypothetical protein
MPQEQSNQDRERIINDYMSADHPAAKVMGRLLMSTAQEGLEKFMEAEHKRGTNHDDLLKVLVAFSAQAIGSEMYRLVPPWLLPMSTEMEAAVGKTADEIGRNLARLIKVHARAWPGNKREMQDGGVPWDAGAGSDPSPKS